MSYDDGSVHDRRLVAIFNEHGIRGSFHLNASRLGESEKFITAEEVKSLFEGHEVSAHSFTHPHLPAIPASMVVGEILRDRDALEKLVGYPIRGMSYPFGSYNQEILGLLPGLGIGYARTTRTTGRFGIPDDFLQWHGTCHHRDNLLDRARQFLEASPQKDGPALLYVWGHSYEFERNEPDNNWKLIKEFCALTGGKDTVWYATNVEVVDYVKAARELRFSVDGSLAYNPSAVAVWATVDGAAVEFPPGKVTAP
jgi:peptidoglycan/xylan/chitin deacetylase (PgdA/CDA1 family)